MERGEGVIEGWADVSLNIVHEEGETVPVSSVRDGSPGNGLIYERHGSIETS
jgi:hypothetical protein